MAQMLTTLALEATALARILMQNQGLVRKVVQAEWVKTLPERDDPELAGQGLPMRRMREWTQRQKPNLRDLLPHTNSNVLGTGSRRPALVATPAG